MLKSLKNILRLFLFVGDTRENFNRFIDDLRLLIDLRKNKSEDSG